MLGFTLTKTLIASMAAAALWMTRIGVVGAQPETLPAQPGSQPSPSQPTAQPAPAPPPKLVPPPQPIVVSPADHELILGGEIGPAAHIAGGMAGVFFGFGIGHAIQGRWGRTGWIYTVGEIATAGLFFYGFEACVDSESGNCNAFTLGLLGFVGLRMVEMLDAFIYPPMYNERVKNARRRNGISPLDQPFQAKLHIGPSRGGGLTGGVRFSF